MEFFFKIEVEESVIESVTVKEEVWPVGLLIRFSALLIITNFQETVQLINKLVITN